MKVLVIIIALFVSGCTTCYVTQTGKEHYSGWSDQTRILARHSWIYAQLSQNVYADKFDFNLEPYVYSVEEFDHPEIDFFAELFKNMYTEQYALVFRGTDSFYDFKTGNNPFRAKQNSLGLEIAKSIKDKYSVNYIVVAGHSLGGGIATHVSLNLKGATLYTFNGSPVFKQNGIKVNNTRFSIVEDGEILKIVRAIAEEPDQLYTSIECTKGNAIEEHSMQKLATCLTQIAATEIESANSSLELNNIPRKWYPN